MLLTYERLRCSRSWFLSSCYLTLPEIKMSLQLLVSHSVGAAVWFESNRKQLGVGFLFVFFIHIILNDRLHNRKFSLISTFPSCSFSFVRQKSISCALSSNQPDRTHREMFVCLPSYETQLPQKEIMNSNNSNKKKNTKRRRKWTRRMTRNWMLYCNVHQFNSEEEAGSSIEFNINKRVIVAATCKLPFCLRIIDERHEERRWQWQ